MFRINKAMIFAISCIVVTSLVYPTGYGLAWTKRLDFEGGVSGDDGFSYAGSTVTSSSSNVKSGSKSAQVYFAKGDDCWASQLTCGGIKAISVGDGQELWARAYYMFPAGFSWSASSAGYHRKIMRIRNSSTHHCIDVLSYCEPWQSCGGNGEVMPGNEISPEYAAQTGVFLRPGVWYNVEQYVKVSKGNDGIQRVWINGALVFEKRNHSTLESSGSIDEILFFTYWNGGAPQNQSAFIDNVVITTDRPSGVDSQGNPMIGSTDGGSPTPGTGTFSPPSNLKIIPPVQ